MERNGQGAQNRGPKMERKKIIFIFRGLAQTTVSG
jgi:hypothetical protein